MLPLAGLQIVMYASLHASIQRAISTHRQGVSNAAHIRQYRLSELEAIGMPGTLSSTTLVYWCINVLVYWCSGALRAQGSACVLQMVGTVTPS